MSTTEDTAARRLSKVREKIVERGLRGLLVSRLPNLRYLTGFSGSNGWLLLGEEQAVFFTDGRYQQQVEEEIPGDVGIEVQVPREGLLAELAKRAQLEFGGSGLGFEGRYLPYDDCARLREEASAVKWESVSGVVEELRAVKEPGEVAAIERAAAIAEQGLRETLAVVEIGMREADIAAELEYRLVRLGAERPAFETIVASGPRSALPHASTGSRQLANGDLLLVDFGVRWSGYNSDITRTYCVGEATPRQIQIYDLVLAAQASACDALRPGCEADQVDAAARGIFEAEGLGEYFVHSTGHGLGMEVHEAPSLRRNGAETVQAGMVVTVEPGLYFPGWGGVRIEDDVLVTDRGARSLVDLERDRLQALPL
jgi:Xaa-Pro aminopeptidase